MAAMFFAIVAQQQRDAADAKRIEEDKANKELKQKLENNEKRKTH